MWHVYRVHNTQAFSMHGHMHLLTYRLCADSDSNVMNAIQFLDNLVKVGVASACMHVLYCRPDREGWESMAACTKIHAFLSVLIMMKDLVMATTVPQYTEIHLAMLCMI